jgi:hypothetical protein
MRCFLVNRSYPSCNRAHGETECLGHAHAGSCRRVVDVCESVTIVAVHFSCTSTHTCHGLTSIDPSIDAVSLPPLVVLSLFLSASTLTRHERTQARTTHLAQHARNAIISFALFAPAGVLAHHIPPPHTKRLRHRLHLYNPLRRCTMQ